MDGWMDGWMYCKASPPSLCHSFFPHQCVLIHVPKQNHSKAIHLSKDNQKERKKEEEED